MEAMNELYSDIILEHNQRQENKRLLKIYTMEERGHNRAAATTLRCKPISGTASSSMRPTPATAALSARRRQIL